MGATVGYFKAGVSFKDTGYEIKPLLNLGLSTKLKQDDIEYKVSISAKSDISETHIFNLKSEVKKWLTPKVNIFGLYKHEYYNEKEDFQFKIGVGVKI